MDSRSKITGRREEPGRGSAEIAALLGHTGRDTWAGRRRRRGRPAMSVEDHLTVSLT